MVDAVSHLTGVPATTGAAGTVSQMIGRDQMPQEGTHGTDAQAGVHLSLFIPCTNRPSFLHHNNNDGRCAHCTWKVNKQILIGYVSGNMSVQGTRRLEERTWEGWTRRHRRSRCRRPTCRSRQLLLRAATMCHPVMTTAATLVSTIPMCHLPSCKSGC